MKKECFRCKIELDIESFPFSKGKRSGVCRECKRKYDREYHMSRSEFSKKRKVENQKVLKHKIKDEIGELKSKLRCKVCGENRIPTLDFHHRNSSEKEMNVGDMINGGFGIERILKEIEKCDVLCSNCHRVFHSEE